MDTPPRRSMLHLLLRKRLVRTVLLLVGIVVLLVVLSKGCSPSVKDRGEGAPPAETRLESSGETGELPPPPDGFDESLPVAQQYKALVTSYGERVARTENELAAAREELKALSAQIREARDIRGKGRDEAEDLLKRLKEATGTARPSDGMSRTEISHPQAIQTTSNLTILEFPPPPPAPEKKRRLVHVPAATSGLATVLNGVFAPVSGEPAPVRLRFDAALLGPNRSRIPMRNAYLIGKAQGDANSSRVTIQIERLSYVTEAGVPIDSTVHGYVVGHDGLEGIPGKYEWRATEVLPLAAMSSGVAAGAKALAYGETTSSLTPLGGATNIVTGNPLKFAGFRAVSGASDKFSDLIVDRLREIRPAVSIPKNRKVQVVFLEGLTLEGLGQEELDDERDFDPFRGLDIHR